MYFEYNLTTECNLIPHKHGSNHPTMAYKKVMNVNMYEQKLKSKINWQSKRVS